MKTYSKKKSHIFVFSAILIFLFSCSSKRVMVELEKKPKIAIDLESDTLLIIPFSFTNLSHSKDFYHDGPSDIFSELYRKLSSENKIKVVNEQKTLEITDEFIADQEQALIVPLDILAQIADNFNIQYIILGDIIFDTIDASSYDRFEEWDPRIRRYRTYNVWVRRRRFKIELEYMVYSAKENEIIEKNQLKREITVEDYQQQVYGFWMVMPSMADQIVNTFASKSVKASKYILR